VDKVLNLSAFGEVLEKPKPDDLTFNFFKNTTQGSETPVDGNNQADSPDSEKKIDPEDSPVSSIALKNLYHTSQIKLFHWQTNSYAEHKALDSLFSGMVDLGDQLVESMMGKYGRPTINETPSKSSLQTYQDGCLSEFLDSLIFCYTEECKKKLDPKRDADLANIVDEIIALVNQTKYLITLK